SPPTLPNRPPRPPEFRLTVVPDGTSTQKIIQRY
ncbi:50S ribosomal protein L10, partial [Stenotrophomonas maltophilia]|nr:50S ribosomal protein L10 [Stenotrophomonas maltophilia]